jgi:uncharacterized protein (UPF0332 family)
MEPVGELARYRLSRACETLEDAELLADSLRWKSCVNRLYYACFYAASAALAHHNLSSSKHAGILSLFNLHFVKAGILPKQTAEIYNDLFDDRQEGDYTDFISFSEDHVMPQIEKARSFIDAIKKYLFEGMQNASHKLEI